MSLSPRVPTPLLLCVLPLSPACSHALAANALPHLYPRSSKKFEAAVAEFRSGHEAAMAAAAQAG